MLRALPLIAVVLGSTPPVEFDHSHRIWTDVLESHVRGEGLDYERLKEDRGKLDAYLGSLEAVMPEEFAAWKREEQLAFWIDAYNAYTVQRVLDAYPIASIKDLGKDGKDVGHQEFIPLGRLFPEAADRKLSLDDIEDKILRPRFKDARVHAAIHNATRGCPALRARAFVAKSLDDQLDAQVTRWLADPGRNRFDKEKKKVVVSRIFDWFKDDFVRDAGSVQAWLAARAPDSERAWLAAAKDVEIEYADYSWQLNDAK